ncbi:MAG: sensor histidine kinase [Pseudolabrys sp.]
MTRSSLRLRLLAGGIVAILIALTLAGAGLVMLFERHVTRSVADNLEVHLKQLLAGIDVDEQGRLIVTRPPADPRFADALSGLYWQISDDRGELLRSRSLWDTTLSLPKDVLAPGEVHRHEMSGPADTRVLVTERMVILTISGRRVPVRVAVAADLAQVAQATVLFGQDMMVALGLLGLVLTVAALVQIGLGLRPLDGLRRGIADIRADRISRLPSAVPVEVSPLVEEVNALLDEQDREIERSRGRAADLAHGLKTPLAALSADAGRLRAQGEHAIARDIESVGEAMRRHVDRELARARVRGAGRRQAGLATELLPLVRSLIATLARTPAGQRVRFEPFVAETHTVPLDRADLAEVLGNLLDNAARHAASRVRISVADVGGAYSIVIEDDGAGIAAADQARVVEHGIRLDERAEGAGLGLAIVQDVLDAYGWRLTLAESDLGGLKATVAPARG